MKKKIIPKKTVLMASILASGLLVQAGPTKLRPESNESVFRLTKVTSEHNSESEFGCGLTCGASCGYTAS